MRYSLQACLAFFLRVEITVFPGCLPFRRGTALVTGGCTCTLALAGGPPLARASVMPLGKLWLCSPWVPHTSGAPVTCGPPMLLTIEPGEHMSWWRPENSPFINSGRNSGSLAYEVQAQVSHSPGVCAGPCTLVPLTSSF